MIRPALLAAPLLATAAPALASPASEAVCKRLGAPRPPAADQPTATQRRALKGCDTQALYYGVGRAPDPAAARLCAFAGEGTDADQQPFGGPTILMQLYANGLGVRRDLDLATAYACAIDGASAEIEGRVEHLQALKRKPAAGRFDYCDDVTSGLNGGFCSARDSQIAAAGREGRLRAAQARLAPAARPLWPAARKAFDAFVDALGEGEVDQSGTGRASFVIEAEDKARDRFTADLEALAAGRWTPATAEQARTADAALNAAYRRAIAHIGGHAEEMGTIDAKGVQKAQRAWLTYRDRFVAYARAARPDVTAEAVLARLTQLRTEQLRELVP